MMVNNALMRDGEGMGVESSDPLLQARVNSYPSQGSANISRRIDELDREISSDEVVAAVRIALAGSALVAKRRLPTLISLVAAACAPALLRLPFLARRRLRTRREIEAEQLALKVVRGDFDGITNELSRRACAMQALRAC